MTSSTVFRSATIDDYVGWLTRWLTAGNRPTHYYDYPFNGRSWLVALRNFETGGECGAAAAEIIVPQGLRHAGGELGHNNLYLHEGPELRGGWVPVYSDPVFVDLGLAEYIDAEQEEQRRWEAERAARKREHDAVPSDVKRHFAPENTDPDQHQTLNLGDDATVLNALAGGVPGPDLKVTLPSGEIIDGSQIRVMRVCGRRFTTPPPDEERPRRRWWRLGR